MITMTCSNLLYALQLNQGNIWDGRLTLLSTETSASIEKTLASGVTSVACSASTGNSFIGRDDGNLSIYSDCLEEVGMLSVHDDIITAVSVNPFDDAKCVSVSWDGQIGLVDCTASHVDVINGHSGIINGISHNTIQPGVFGTIGKDSFLRLWDSRSINEGCTGLLPLHQIGSTCCWSSQSEYLIACGMEDGCIHVVDVRTNNVVTSKNNHNGRITKLVSPKSSGGSASVNSSLISAAVDNLICAQDFDLSVAQCNRSEFLIHIILFKIIFVMYLFGVWYHPICD
jgi:WD40 repeat protein